MLIYIVLTRFELVRTTRKIVVLPLHQRTLFFSSFFFSISTLFWAPHYTCPIPFYPLGQEGRGSDWRCAVTLTPPVPHVWIGLLAPSLLKDSILSYPPMLGLLMLYSKAKAKVGILGVG